MVINSGFNFTNQLSRYIIKDGYITPAVIPGTIVIKSEAKKIFNNCLGSQADLKDLIFMDFISIDTNDESKILSFVNKYGLLQIGYNGSPHSYVEKEPVSDYIFEIELMRTVVNLKQAMDELNYNNLKEYLKNLYEYIPENEFEDTYPYLKDFGGKIGIEDLALCSGSAISLYINKRMKFIDPVMIYINNFSGHWDVPSLISAMSFELFLSFSQNAKFKKCQRASCDRYFKITRTDERKIYCTNECAKLEWQRKNRLKNKKEREV